MAEFKLGRIRFIWKGDWVASTVYVKDDIVRYGGSTFVCVIGHTADSDFYTDLDNVPARWNQLSEGQQWQGNWTTSTYYKVNDIVKYGGLLYVCNEGHESAASLSSGLEDDQSKWDLFAEGIDWKGIWTTNTRYKINDLTRYGGISYICNEEHTSAATASLGLEADQSKWDLYAETFEWKNNWSTSVRYKRNDLVRYGGQTYVCNDPHTSAATVSLGLEADQSKWDYFNQGLEYKQTWSPASVRYKANDIVKYGAGLWICITHHTSSATFDLTKWEQFVEALEFENSWDPTTSYQQGDIVTYGGYVYVSKTTNNIAQRPTTNSDDWDVFTTGFKFRGDWGEDSSTMDYRVGDIVRQGGYTYVAILDNNNQQPPNPTFWSRLNYGIRWRGLWSDDTEYELGDAVRYGPNSYICIQSHVSEGDLDDSTVATNSPPEDTLGIYWNVLTTGNENEVMTTTGDIVYYDGAGPTRLPVGNEGQTLTVTNGIPDWKYWGVVPSVYYVGLNGTNGSVSEGWGLTLDKPFRTIRYASELIEKGAKYPNVTNLLTRNRAFIQKEVTGWISAQIAGSIAPFVLGFTYDSVKCERDIGYIVDALAYDLSHGGNSRSRAAALAYVTSPGNFYILGQEQETAAAIDYALVVIDAVISNSSPLTVYQGVVTQVVDATKTEEDGAQPIIDDLVEIITDAVLAGVSTSIPAELKSNYTIFVKTGTFNEVLPIAVPELTAVVGDELRSTRIEPAPSVIHSTDVPVSLASLTRIRDIVSNVIQNTPVVKSAGNPLTQVTSRPAGSGAAGTAAVNDLQNIIDYINFYVNAVGSAPAITGTNTPTATQAFYDAANVLEENKEFLAEEAVAFANVTYTTTCTATATGTNLITCVSTSWMALNMAIRFTGTTFGNILPNITYYVRSIPGGTTFTVSLTRDGSAVPLSNGAGSMTVRVFYDQDACKNDIREYVDALKYDLIYTGNYKSLWAAEHYANAALGSTTKNMFYLRNGTGLRNCTVAGLVGTLGTPNSYGTQRPTAGAYASLDPGWGPNDQRVWIATRSPYVQNVTTFGTAAIGMKVDGALHAGGNDSIVANDFTQVISDGIGAWVTNLGRAELVSVFSYYAHIGYLAENGGKVRATNGNSSYGAYGCVAEGVDSTETPVTATVNNRNFEAEIGYVFTSGSQILGFEYLNAGQEYSSGTYTINGAGVNAATVGDEIRDNGVFQVRILDPGDSSIPGGADYVTATNNAQTGNATQITIAATDTADSTAYVGMRIVIVAGLGVGQYGYINTYNAGSKVATVLRDSTGTSGWDHIVPGTPIASLLDVTTVYVIEPRLTFSAPGFTSTARSLSSSLDWTEIAYTSGTVQYTNVLASGGAGAGATFDITKTNGRYKVSINNRGAGYVNGNTLTIVGANLGGATPTNNLTITVATTFTGGKITGISTSGTAMGGEFVAVATGTNLTAISANGTAWIAGGSLPASTTWTSVAGGVISGTTYFVAIASGGTQAASSVDDGATWASRTLPATATWSNVAYGNSRFIAVASGGTANAISTNGTTWTSGGALPASATWTAVAFGEGIWVAVASGGTTAASSANNGTSWTARTLPSSGNWSSVAFGNNRFVAVASGGTAAAYSLDGITWTASTLPATSNWSHVAYGQGLFFAVSTSGTQAATSPDGVTWTSRTMSASAGGYDSIVFGNPSDTSIWAAIGGGTTTVASSVATGATAFARAAVADGKIFQIRVLEPGSGYTSAPTMTITDPNNTVEAVTARRLGNGVLANPTFNNRGTGYVTASAEVTGDGFADYFQTGSYVYVAGLNDVPVPGSNVQFSTITGVFYKLVTVTELLGNGPYTARLQLSPLMGAAEAPTHDEAVTIRIKYSQVRLTGHDFLDIGTGNFANTNYPGLPLIAPDKEKEVNEFGGGRVFFTSTDQDGNFNVGDLFTVEQSTGVATLNADAFSLAGLQELQLGSVALGGTGATITEFSTDPTFAADSDSVIPTQRAIKAYISSQIGGGGGSLNVNSLTAGIVFVSGDTITTTTNAQINVTAKMNFTGGIDGSPVAMSLFLHG